MKIINSLKPNKYLIILFTLIIFFVFTMLFFLNNNTNNEKLISSLQNSLILTKNIFEEEKKYAMSLAILLSQNKQILDSFIKKNREESFRIINEKIFSLKTYQNTNIEVQIHNEDLSTYLRNWDIKIKDVPLKSFRKGLIKVKKNLKPIVSIELGQRLNIKAIAPFIRNNNFIGSIEVIIGFDKLSKKLNENNLDIFILLDNKFLKIAKKEKNAPKFKNYTIINKNIINKKVFENIFNKELSDYGYFTTNKFAFSYFSYYDLDKNKLGYIIVSTKNDSSISINNTFKNKISKLQNGITIE